MDDKEREKVIEAIHKWTEKKGIDFGHGWDAEIADFHLAETQELRRQLQKAVALLREALISTGSSTLHYRKITEAIDILTQY